MAVTKGFSASSRLARLMEQYATIEAVRLGQYGLSTLAHMFVRLVGADAVEALSTTSAIVATAHAAQKGDVIRITSGALIGLEAKVSETSANLITLAEDLPSAPATLVTFDILRHKYPLVDVNGNLQIGLVALPVGASTEAKQDVGNASLASIDGKITAVNTGAVTVAASALPAGASTAAKQDTQIASLASIDGKITAVNTGAVTVAASALPVGASTAAKQDTQIASLASIDGKITAVNTGAVTVAASALPAGAATEATLAALNGKVTAVNTGAVTIAASALPAGASTEATLAAQSAKLPATLGQKAMAASLAVVLANDQTSIPVAATLAAGSSIKPAGLAYSDSIRLAAGTVTTAAWTQLIAVTAAAAQGLMVFDSSGQTLELGIGAAAAEVRKMIIPPGGLNGFIPLAIAAGSRVSVRALSANADYTAAELDLTLIG